MEIELENCENAKQENCEGCENEDACNKGQGNITDIPVLTAKENVARILSNKMEFPPYLVGGYSPKNLIQVLTNVRTAQKRLVDDFADLFDDAGGRPADSIFFGASSGHAELIRYIDGIIDYLKEIK